MSSQSLLRDYYGKKQLFLFTQAAGLLQSRIMTDNKFKSICFHGSVRAPHFSASRHVLSNIFLIACRLVRAQLLFEPSQKKKEPQLFIMRIDDSTFFFKNKQDQKCLSCKTLLTSYLQLIINVYSPRVQEFKNSHNAS